MSGGVFVCGGSPSSFHPWECRPGCIHCAGTKTDDHDPADCVFCHATCQGCEGCEPAWCTAHDRPNTLCDCVLEAVPGVQDEDRNDGLDRDALTDALHAAAEDVSRTLGTVQRAKRVSRDDLEQRFTV